MYVGDDVSPDFYGWVFPKYDHVAVGTGTVINKTAIKQYQQARRVPPACELPAWQRAPAPLLLCGSYYSRKAALPLLLTA